MQSADAEPVPTASLATAALTPEPLSLLDNTLRLFTEVRPGEGLTAVIMFANVFLILCAYYLVKPLRDGWIAVSPIKGFSSVEVKACTSFAQSVALIGAMALYARLATRLPRRELITRTTVFCISSLLVFWMLYHAQIAIAAIAFYIWVGILGMFVVSQFWAFAADLYPDERGRRIMPMIAIGGAAGAVAGSLGTEAVVRSNVLDSSTLLLLANIPLLASIALTALADARGPTGQGSHPPGPRPPAVPTATDGGKHIGVFALVSGNRYLLAVAGITLLTNWVITNGDNLLFLNVQNTLATDLAARGGVDAAAMQVLVREGITAFYGSFFFWVNLCALGLQAFVASRLLKYGGFGATLLLLPVIALFSQSAMAIVPLLLVVRVMKTAERSTANSVNNTAQQVLWLPTTTEMKYKAKPAIDSFFVRVGDGLAALTVLFGLRVYGLETRSLFAFNVVLVVLWFLLGVFVVREHHRLRALQRALAATPHDSAGGDLALSLPISEPDAP